MILLIVAGAILNCCSAQLAGTSSSDTTHSENLSAYRPKVATEQPKKDTSLTASIAKPTVASPSLTVNKKVDAVLDSIDKLNQTRKYVDGYTLQIYSGTIREEAMETKKQMSLHVPELIPALEYNQPKFRVTVGSYFTRLEAQKDLLRIKQFFPNTILVPERVSIK